MPDSKLMEDVPGFMHLVRHGGQYLTGRILHIGSGAMPFARNFKGEWVGLDMRPVADITGDAHDIPQDDESFDSVLIFNMLESCPSPLRVMQEAARVLKKGGHVVICATATSPDKGQLWGIHANGLRYLVAAAGLELICDPITDGKCFSGQFAEFANHVPFTPISADMFGGWLSQMDAKYPTIVYTVAKKP